MVLVYKKDNYPDTPTYTGNAYEAWFMLRFPRLGPIPNVNELAISIIDAGAVVISTAGGKMLRGKVYLTATFIGPMPIWELRSVFQFFTVRAGLIEPVTIALIAAAIIAVLLAAGFAVWLGGQGIHDIFITKPGEEPIFPKEMFIILGIGALALGGAILVSTVTKALPAIREEFPRLKAAVRA